MHVFSKDPLAVGDVLVTEDGAPGFVVLVGDGQRRRALVRVQGVAGEAPQGPGVAEPAARALARVRFVADAAPRGPGQRRHRGWDCLASF